MYPYKLGINIFLRMYTTIYKKMKNFYRPVFFITKKIKAYINMAIYYPSRETVFGRCTWTSDDQFGSTEPCPVQVYTHVYLWSIITLQFVFRAVGAFVSFIKQPFLANLYPELSFLAVACISVDCSWPFAKNLGHNMNFGMMFYLVTEKISKVHRRKPND